MACLLRSVLRGLCFRLRVPGDAMPQDVIKCEGRRRGTRHSTCRANDQVNGWVPGTDLVNGAVVRNGCRAAESTKSNSVPAGTLNGTRQQWGVNGYINYRYKAKSTNAAQKQGGGISSVTNASAAGRVNNRGIPGGVSVSGATSLDTVAFTCYSDRRTPELSPSAAKKNQRRRKKFRHHKRDTEATCPENSSVLLVPPTEEEDWEHEIQKLPLTDWEKMYFGVRPYGPEDVLQDVQALTLEQRDTVDLPVTVGYRPFVHHPCPIKWSYVSHHAEPDQFSDADEGCVMWWEDLGRFGS
uniref:uncharacterized protein LOC109958379 isoform X3 n=1 Tax=Monopterus albus TaxID=43700 RepID=UPI0009B4BD6B|nr:uncharacterized protein LOC109958379 isoform X3 [Monopterus albus]